ncbi:MAG: phage portal protein [Xanthomonadales bacterium]|nr:phage portal protein [Xanthomonadales bacterium]
MYVIEYNAEDEATEKMIAYRETTEHMRTADGFADAWMVNNYVMRDGKTWELVKSTEWPYSFPPICHWQNLPDAESVYGDSDITEDMIVIQDAINFVASNVQRIIRYHAHPKTWGRGFSTAGTASWGADEMVTINGADGTIQNLEMRTDLASSREFLHYLRGVLFDISRTVDIAAMTDKLGAMTNFALRVLYKDALDKLESKRLLYGWGLSEINRRCLLLAGIATDTGGAVVWPDPLPSDTVEQAKELQIDLGEGLVDKQTASTLRGYDWETVSARLDEEKANDTTLGDQLLRAFENGGAAGSTVRQEQRERQDDMETDVTV